MHRLESWIETAGLVVEAVGVAVIVLGAALASGLALLRFRTLGPVKTYAAYRVGLARSILLGLELLVAGDMTGRWWSRPRSRTSRCSRPWW